MSSAYHPLNLWDETAVKTVKRIITGNMALFGFLNINKFVAVLLQYRTTTDRDLKLCPAQIPFAGMDLVCTSKREGVG